MIENRVYTKAKEPDVGGASMSRRGAWGGASATSSSSSMNGYLPSERRVKEQTISFYLFGPTLLWCDW